MRGQPIFFFFIGIGFLCDFGFAALLHLGIKNQLYIWEFKIDLKPVVFGALCYFFNRKFRIGFTLSKSEHKTGIGGQTFLLFSRRSGFSLFSLWPEFRSKRLRIRV